MISVNCRFTQIKTHSKELGQSRFMKMVIKPKGAIRIMNNKARKTLYLVAGIYLFYLAFQLLTGLGENGNTVVSLIGGIAFIIIGGFLLFDYIRSLKNGFEEEKEEEEEEESCE